jgi:hypothetical protein
MSFIGHAALATSTSDTYHKYNSPNNQPQLRLQ